MNELALFAGAGGGILGGKILGWRTVCAVEIDRHCRDVLVARQNDGCLEPFPIWDDVRTFDGRSWRGRVDVVSGGFPCTDISCAGKGAGLDGKQSGLWSEMRRIIGEVRPRYVFIENSPMLTIRGGTRVIGDLAKLGFDARWGVVGAHHTGAPHKRDRMWIVAHTASARCQARGGDRMGAEHGPCRNEGQLESASSQTPVAHSECKGLEGQSGNEQGGSKPGRQCKEARRSISSQSIYAGSHSNWWDIEPDVGRVAHGVAHRVDRLRAIGNGQVPACAALAWNILQ